MTSAIAVQCFTNLTIKPTGIIDHFSDHACEQGPPHTFLTLASIKVHTQLFTLDSMDWVINFISSKIFNNLQSFYFCIIEIKVSIFLGKLFKLGKNEMFWFVNSELLMTNVRL